MLHEFAPSIIQNSLMIALLHGESISVIGRGKKVSTAAAMPDNRTHLFVEAAGDGADYDPNTSSYCSEERYRGSCACTLMVDRRPDKRTRRDAHNASNNCSYNGVRCAVRVSRNPLVELGKECTL
jgi:hypothetical protein